MKRLDTELARLLKAQIRANGPMTFRDFMAAALFHDTYGFYSLAPAIGSSVGPFDTNAKFPAFGFAIAQAIQEATKILGGPLRILELGGGTGQLGSWVSSFLADSHDYVILETSPGLRAKQTEKGLRAIASFNELNPGKTIVFGNEVLDAFPVHRVMGMENDQICEVFVALDKDGELCEQPGEVSTSKLLDRLHEEKIFLGRGHLAEICLEIQPLLHDLVRVIQPGYIIFVDYGDNASNLYSYHHRNGRMRYYYQQQEIHDPFFAVGQQDMTSDVDFTAVISAATSVGLEWVGWMAQGTWLTNLGIQRYVGTGKDAVSRQQDVDMLTRAARLGSAFDVLMFKTPGLPHGPGFSPVA